MMFTFNASSREMPAPSHPATLLTMMLLVTVAEYHGDLDPMPGNVTLLLPFGKLITSEPLRCCRRSPPPLPLSAALCAFRLALWTSPGPMPALGPTEPRGRTQSWSVEAPQGGLKSGEPNSVRPPPL